MPPTPSPYSLISKFALAPESWLTGCSTSDGAFHSSLKKRGGEPAGACAKALAERHMGISRRLRFISPTLYPFRHPYLTRNRFPVLHQMVRRAPRQSLNRERRVARTAGSHKRRTQNAEILRLMREAPAIRHVRLRVIAHPRAAEGMRTQTGDQRRLHKHLDRAPCPVPLLQLLLRILDRPRLVLLRSCRHPADRIPQRIANPGVEIEKSSFVREGGRLQIRRREPPGLRSEG